MASLAGVYPIKTRLLVCGDLFDRDGTHWQQSMGLGEFIDSDPPAKTVFFEGVVKKHVSDTKIEVYFPFDRTRSNLELTQVYKIIDDNTSYPVFWVFRPGKPGLYKVRGVTFEKAGPEDIKIDATTV